MVNLIQHDVQDRRKEKEARNADRRVEQAFFNPALGAEYFRRAAECRAKTRAALLQKNRGDEENRENNLDDGEEESSHR